MSEDNVSTEVLKPLLKTLDQIGSPRAADMLSAFLMRTPALSNLEISKEVLVSHAKAFNAFRNATLHYAGLPSKVSVRFQEIEERIIKQKTSRKTLVRVMIYYTNIMRQLILLHFIRTANAKAYSAERTIEGVLSEFFNKGIYNGLDFLNHSYLEEERE